MCGPSVTAWWASQRPLGDLGARLAAPSVFVCRPKAGTVRKAAHRTRPPKQGQISFTGAAPINGLKGSRRSSTDLRTRARLARPAQHSAFV